MGNKIKSLLDSIIDGGGESPKRDGEVNAKLYTHDNFQRTNFSSTDFREKLSMAVLKDIVSAMMHDETKDVNELIDDSIMNHINNDYKGTCFGYLCKARDRLNSPILGNIIQEIEATAADVANGIENGDDAAIEKADKPEMTTNEILNSVSNYDELRQKLKDEVSKAVVNDVTKVITKSNDAPVFDNIDNKIKKVDDSTGASSTENTDATVAADTASDLEGEPASESVIMRMTSSIVTEQAVMGNRISTEEGINRAIITYCIGEMDALFAYDKARTIVGKYLH